MSTHLTADRVDDLIDDILPANERLAALAHLDQCDECQQAMSALRKIVRTARALGGIEPPIQSWPIVAIETVLAARARRSAFGYWRVPFGIAAAALVVSTAAVVNRVDNRRIRRAVAAEHQLQRIDAQATAAMPSLQAIPAPLFTDSAFYFARERALRERLTPRGRLVLAAAESLAVIDGAISRARASTVGADRSKVIALLEQRHFYMRGVLRALGEDVEHDAKPRTP